MLSGVGPKRHLERKKVRRRKCPAVYSWNFERIDCSLSM